MPKEGENIPKFNNFHKQQAVPFVIYADFEAITNEVQGSRWDEESLKFHQINHADIIITGCLLPLEPPDLKNAVKSTFSTIYDSFFIQYVF